jgi:hypothetical protein
VRQLRAIPGFVRLLVGLFLVAQFAGVVSSPRASALPVAAALAAHDHNHHASGHADQRERPDHHGHGNLADTCCALHAYFAGVLPPAVAIKTESVIGEPLLAHADDLALGIPGGRLDRPPRPLC